MTPDVSFVAMTTDHLDAVARIEQASSLLPWPRDLFAGELDVPVALRHWLVAVDESGAVLGFGGMMLLDDEAHLMNIAVDPAHRRDGIARRLLHRLVVDIVGLGARHLTLEVRPANDAALMLYRRFEMAPVGVRRDYYGPGEDALILWVHDIDRPEYLAGLAEPTPPARRT